jgi:hypothetical protein
MTDTTTVGVFVSSRTGTYTTGVGGGYDKSSGTSIPGRVVSARTAADPVPATLSGWLGSEASRPYEGRWVVLSKDADVVAAGDTPGALPDAVTREPDNIVLFVLPRNVVISG